MDDMELQIGEGRIEVMAVITIKPWLFAKAFHCESRERIVWTGRCSCGSAGGLNPGTPSYCKPVLTTPDKDSEQLN